MMGHVAVFEFRYQAGRPLFRAASVLLFLAAFTDMAALKLISVGGGNVLFNSPHAVIVSHLLVSFIFLFIGAAFVANVVLRDDETGFGPILRSTGISKTDYLLGRFVGAFTVGAVVMAMATLGAGLGSLMPLANREMFGPHDVSAFLYGYGLFALPNALIISAILFALATITRSTAGTFIGIIVLLVLYLVSQQLLAGQPQLADLRVLADPFGLSTYMAGSRYFTAAELNAGTVPVSGLMVAGRLLWAGVAIVLLALTCRLYRFRDPAISAPRRVRGWQRVGTVPKTPGNYPGDVMARLSPPRFDGRTAQLQFRARTAMEARLIVRSPTFLVLLLIAFALTLPGLLTASTIFGTPVYPLPAIAVPIIEQGFSTVLVIIAAYFGGEVVWRERECRMHELVDAAPLPALALLLPKVLGLLLVLLATLGMGLAAGLLVQLLDATTGLTVGSFVVWYLLPGMVDAGLVAVLAVFIQALSPGKHAGWGLMVVYLLLLTFGPSFGLAHPLLVYGAIPAVPLSEMAGTGNHLAAAWWLRLCWASVAVLLLVTAHLLWPRGTEVRWEPRWAKLPGRLRGPIGRIAACAALVMVLAGSWIAYNTLVLNEFRTAVGGQEYLAEYERRHFRHARLPQPVVRHVELEIALFPDETRADVRGRYLLVNETDAPMETVHVRLMDRELVLEDLDFPAARLESDDKAFGYRTYRLDRPMQSGESREFTFRTRRRQQGFRVAGTETAIVPNGTDLNTLQLTPRIGMSDVGLIQDPAARRRLGLADMQPLPRLDDPKARMMPPGGDLGWTTADITVSTSSDQVPVAPGRKVAEHVGDGRRSVRFVSDVPTKNFFSIQSGRYAVREQTHGGVEHSIYYHPAHSWNVERMMTAMRASTDYFSEAFGPYQFGQLRIVETPAYREGAQAFANTIALGETAGFTLDMANPGTVDMVTMMTAHEVSHQWWGHQVVGARMQGAGFLHESLAQYSALMVLKRLQGEDKVRRLLQFQLDRYLAGRRTHVLPEQPLAAVELGQQYIAYGKGALAMYLLQHRIGEEAVNRALRKFVHRHRFTKAPYPRSLDLIALLREEATSSEDQALITDLFERITLYDLKVDQPRATRRPDGRWDVVVTVHARKFYANGTGDEQETPMSEPIDIGLFAAEPGTEVFDRTHLVRLEAQEVRTGRQEFHFVTTTLPSHAGVDPYNLYIDRDSFDNVGVVTPGAPARHR